MIFQAYTSFPWLTVFDNVAFGLSLDGMAKNMSRARARELLKRVGLGAFESAYPSQLSGGMPCAAP